MNLELSPEEYKTVYSALFRYSQTCENAIYALSQKSAVERDTRGIDSAYASKERCYDLMGRLRQIHDSGKQKDKT